MRLEQRSMWEVPRDKAPRCKYGHKHWDYAQIYECEERTLRALCVSYGLDYDDLRGKPLYTGPLPPDAEQLELF